MDNSNSQNYQQRSLQSEATTPTDNSSERPAVVTTSGARRSKRKKDVNGKVIPTPNSTGSIREGARRQPQLSEGRTRQDGRKFRSKVRVETVASEDSDDDGDDEMERLPTLASFKRRTEVIVLFLCWWHGETAIKPPMTR